MQADTLPTERMGYRQSLPVTMSIDKQHNLYIQGHVTDTGNIATLLLTDSNGRIKSKRSYKLFPSITGNPFMVHTVRSPYNTLVHFGSMEFQQLVPGIIDTLGTYGWLMQTDSFGCMQPGCEIADSIWHYDPSAIVTTQDYEQDVLYPNPANHSVTLEGIPLNSKYELVDMRGTAVINGTIQEPRTVINVETLVPSVYIIRILVKDKPPIQLRLVKE